MIWALVLLALASPPRTTVAGTFEVLESTQTPDGPWTETLLRFPSSQRSPWPANDTVWAHLLVPNTGGCKAAPAVLILPVMAAPNVWIEMQFARRFVRDGFVVMWIEMPTQFHRRPDPSMPSGQVFLARTPKRLAANFRQSVADARRAIGVLAGRPEVDPDRIGLFGISLGAIVGSVVYSLDSRPRFAAFLLGGADFPALAFASSLTGPFVRKMGLTPESLKTAWSGLDPLQERTVNREKPALLVNAIWDTVVPRDNALKLAAEWPAARQFWVPGGHYTSIIHMLWLPSWVSARMQKALAPMGKKAIKDGEEP